MEKQALNASPHDIVGKTLFLGCPSAAFVRPDRYCYHYTLWTPWTIW